jgi:hypothetical protein
MPFEAVAATENPKNIRKLMIGLPAKRYFTPTYTMPLPFCPFDHCLI